jgi:ABC-2 type transport system permease protein
MTKRPFFTVFTFAKLNTRRYFRDRTAIFFTVLFPLIFLFIFGGIFGKGGEVSFRVALINQSDTPISKIFVEKAKKETKLFKIDQQSTTLDKAKEKMNRGELDAAIVVPAEFGAIKTGQRIPSGALQIYYTQNNQQAAQTLQPVLQAGLLPLNSEFVETQMPFTVHATQTNDRSLSSFDYTFSGLLGFSLLGLGIFGPINVFPELKKQGILRRFSTTPIRVWQYFTANMISQVIIGLFAISIMFVVALTVFHLNLVGNVAELVLYIALGIITMLGFGLAVGGWARNERQAAPLANLITFPMMFLSGTFFPRFLMPDWLQQISNYIPLSPIIDGIRLIATEGKHLTDLLPQLGVIGLWVIIIYFIAFRVFRWE